MPRKRTNRGQIIFDEGADHRLINPVINAGWKVKTIVPQDKNIGLRDSTILEKYTRGRYPIFTKDYSIYQAGTITAGVIEHEPFGKQQTNEKRYMQKVETFMSSITASDIRRTVWRIPLQGEPRMRAKIKLL